jgi:hypothetical protein
MGRLRLNYKTLQKYIASMLLGAKYGKAMFE